MPAAPVLLHEYVPQELGSIEPGVDNTARVNAAIQKVASLDGFQKALVRGTITVDGTLGGTDLADICVQNERSGDGFQWLTDGGPNPDYTAQNNRAHWRYVNSTNAWVCGLTLNGTHDLWDPNRSPDVGTERDIWEGQTGVALVGGTDGGAVGVKVRNIWGDGYAVVGYSKSGRAQDVKAAVGHTIWNCSLDRNGRVALLLNGGVEDLTVDGLDAINFVSSYYHIEVATSPLRTLRNIHLIRGRMRRGQERTPGGRFITFTSGTECADFWIEDNHLIGHALNIHMAAKGDEQWERWDRFMVARNVHDRVATADELITAWKIDGFTLANNSGPRDAKCKVFDADARASCTNVVETGNKFPIVA